MWIIYATTNRAPTADGADYEEHDPQGPWTLDQVHAYIKLTLEADPTATSFEFILVPDPSYK